jgi:hypothetical protein
MKIASAIVAVMISHPVLAQVAGPKWQPNEVVKNDDGLVSRSGTTPKGNPYWYNDKGRGYVLIIGAEMTGKGWNTECEIDPITDAKECHLQRGATPLLLDMGSGTTVKTICIIRHNFPGRRGAIRVDSNPAVATNANGCVSSPALVKQLLNGQKVTVRWVNWPRDYSVDAISEIGPLQEALDLTGYIRRSLNNFGF